MTADGRETKGISLATSRRLVLQGSVTILAGGLGLARQAHARGADAPSHRVGELEEPIDPSLPIIDAHHHMFDDPGSEKDPRRRYLLPELLADIEAGGHKITHTVFVQHGTSSMYRADGPEALKPVGEVEFANGIAAMSASGRYGPCRVAAGIVSSADMRLGAAAKRVLEAEVAAGDGRLRGIRFSNVYADVPIFGGPKMDPARRTILREPKVREAIALLEPMGLSLDTWCFHPEIDEVADLAAALPNTTIILNHLGSPLHLGRYASKPAQVFADWKRSITELARRPNVVVKVGGLGMVFEAPVGAVKLNASSVDLAKNWRPCVETTIEAFGPSRCMFESNFPPDSATCSYGTIWNTFKRISAQYSPHERDALFSGTAKKIYRL